VLKGNKLIKLGKDKVLSNGRVRNASLVLVIPYWWLKDAGFEWGRDEIALDVKKGEVIGQIYILINNIDINNKVIHSYE